MSCKTLNYELLPIDSHLIKELPSTSYEVIDNSPIREVTVNLDKTFEFLYCVSYRDPTLPEWILARWYWNDAWVWTPDGIFPM